MQQPDRGVERIAVCHLIGRLRNRIANTDARIALCGTCSPLRPELGSAWEWGFSRFQPTEKSAAVRLPATFGGQATAPLFLPEAILLLRARNTTKSEWSSV